MLQGTIDEFPLMDVLGILQARNKTGRLEIERQAGRGLIYVRLGEPYYAESSLTRSLIGQKLVDIGAITNMQLRKALDHQADSGERLGQILLTHGVISADDVAKAVISQIKDALADLLAWEAGEFRWETGAEVEVEVPLFGVSNGSTGEGSNPLAPHVVPINTKEPDTGPDTIELETMVAQPDFLQGGTTMTGNEVTAKSIESFPEAGQDPSPESVHSSFELVDETEVEEVEPEPLAESNSQTEQEAETDDEGTEPEPDAVDELDAQPELESEDEVAENMDEVEETEIETVHELNEDEDEVDEPEDMTETETESVHEQDDDEDEVDEPEGMTQTETEPVAEDGGNESEETEPPPVSLIPDVPLEVPERFRIPRVIRSQPAPELDEEFEAVFEATDHASFEVEPLPEPDAEVPYFDPTPAITPVFGADAFTPIAPVTEFDHPTFVPDRSADPVFDHGNFEPLPENPEPVFGPVTETSDEEADEASGPVFGPVTETSDEEADEASEPVLGPVAVGVDEPVEEAIEPPYWPVTGQDGVDEGSDSTIEPVALDWPNERLDQVPEPPSYWPVAKTTEEQDGHVEDSPESVFGDVVETFDSTSPETEVETPDDSEMVEPQPVEMTHEMPAADPVPIASPPPPPPEVTESDEVEEVPAEKAPDVPSGPVTPESFKDIKLDRSSLVRELSDLLR